MAQLNTEYKAKNKLFKDLQGKLDELDGVRKMTEEIEKLKKKVKELEEKLKDQLKNKGASSSELEQG